MAVRRLAFSCLFGSEVPWKRCLAALAFPDSEALDRISWTANWFRTIKEANCPTFGHVKELYRHLHDEVLHDSPIDYLEFGVAKGTTMRVWLGMNQRPESRFFGFDSFVGLPEDWNPDAPKGTFGTNGIPPEIADARLKFQVGWFQDTLPAFVNSYRPVNRVVIHNDSDLYSSSLYLLTMLDPFISRETVVIFDEAYDVLHEYRALIDYSTAYRKTFRIIAATKAFCQIAVVFSDQTKVPSDAA
jgi:hypothetical protein